MAETQQNNAPAVVEVENLAQDQQYRRVESKPKADPIQDGEIRLTGQGRMKNYIEYATSLLEEKKMDSIIIKAMGKAINKAVACAEIVKRRTPGDLHQHTTIGSVEVKDVYEPLQEGLSKQEFTRFISIISIKLSRQTGDTNAPGYQAPIPQSDHRPDYNSRKNFPEGIGRGGSRGGRGFSRGGRGRGGNFGSRGPVESNVAADSSAPSGQAVNAPISTPVQASLEPLPPRRGGQFRGGRGRGGFSGGRGSFSATPSSTGDAAPTFDSSRGGRGSSSPRSSSPRGGARRGNGNRGSSRGGIRGGPAASGTNPVVGASQ